MKDVGVTAIKVGSAVFSHNTDHTVITGNGHGVTAETIRGIVTWDQFGFLAPDRTGPAEDIGGSEL